MDSKRRWGGKMIQLFLFWFKFASEKSVINCLAICSLIPSIFKIAKLILSSPTSRPWGEWGLLYQQASGSLSTSHVSQLSAIPVLVLWTLIPFDAVILLPGPYAIRYSGKNVWGCSLHMLVLYSNCQKNENNLNSQQSGHIYIFWQVYMLEYYRAKKNHVWNKYIAIHGNAQNNAKWRVWV